MSNSKQLTELKKLENLALSISFLLVVISGSLLWYYKPENANVISNLLIFSGIGLTLSDNKKGLFIYISTVLIVTTVILFMIETFSRVEVICMVLFFCNLILGLIQFYFSEKIEAFDDKENT